MVKKVFVILALSILFIGCQTNPAVIPTTPYIDTAGTQATAIVTQTVAVEKIITNMVVDEKAKKDALNAIGALKATATEHVKTIATLKSVNGIVAQNYGNMRDNMIKYRGQRNAAFIVLIVAALAVICKIILTKALKTLV